jgi:choline kinase
MSDNNAVCTTAILLAAGVGRRLGQAEALPKVLARVGTQTLLERHLAILAGAGMTEVAITIGHQGDLIRRAVADAGFSGLVRFVENARYRDGSLISLWTQQDVLCAGKPFLLMDGDVLYDRRMMARLVDAPGEAVMLVDRTIEPGDEPVKICFRGQTIVDFRKKPEQPHDWHGESVGFFRFSAPMGARLADACARRIAAGETATEYEEAIRDLILSGPRDFHAEDISDLPWTEIDFPEDLVRARDDILPRLVA